MFARISSLLLVILALAACQDSRTEIAALIDDYEGQNVFNGYLYVQFEHETLYQGVVGNNFPKLEKPRFDSPVYLASLTKIFTKLALLRLADEGRLELDDTIFKLRPGFRPAFGKVVTVRHLLEMTSGLPRELDASHALSMVKYDAAGLAGRSLDTIPEISLSGTPGESEIYSNLSYWLLGAIVEEVSESNLDEAFRNLVFEPLGMRHSGLFQSELRPLPSYSFQTGVPRRDTLDYSGRYAAGGAYSSVEDLAQLAEGLRAGFLTGEESQQLLFGENNRVEYYGSLPGASNVFVLDRKADFCFVFLNNAGIAEISKISELLYAVEAELGIEKPARKKRKVKVNPMATLDDSIPFQKAMSAWARAVENGNEKAIFEILESISPDQAFNRKEATWKAFSELPQRFPGWKALGYRYVDERPAGYEIWFGAETGEKMAVRWIAAESNPESVSTIFIQPDDMEWMGTNY